MNSSALVNHNGTKREGPLDLALARGRDYLASLQRADGSWRAYNLFGPVETAQVLIFEKRYGALKPEDASDALRWLRSQQHRTAITREASPPNRPCDSSNPQPICLRSEDLPKLLCLMTPEILGLQLEGRTTEMLLPGNSDQHNQIFTDDT